MNEMNDALDRLKSFCRFVTDRDKPSPKNIAMGILLGGAGLAFVATCARFEWWLGVEALVVVGFAFFYGKVVGLEQAARYFRLLRDFKKATEGDSE